MIALIAMNKVALKHLLGILLELSGKRENELMVKSKFEKEEGEEEHHYRELESSWCHVATS